MRRPLLLLAACLFLAQAGYAQYLYGTVIAGNTQPALYRFDPTTNVFSQILKTFPYYQPISTKDTARKIIYYLVPNMISTDNDPDTLLAVKLADTTLSKRPIAKGSLPFPKYENSNRLISASSKGIVAYDLTTNQYSILDSNVKITGIHSATYDQTNGRYICMRTTSGANAPDTLFVYTMATKTLKKYAVGVNNSSREMVYSPASNKAVFLGIPYNSSAHGIYSFNLGTQQSALEALVPNTGTSLNCSTFDETNNRYFYVGITNNQGTGFNIVEYRLNTNTVVDHLVGPPGLGFAQYFDNLKVSQPPPGTGVGLLNTEEPFRMYPNPAGEQLNVTVDLKGRKASILVLDLTGKTVLKKDVAEATNLVNIASLPGGQYILKVVFEDKAYSRIFTKDK